MRNSLNIIISGIFIYLLIFCLKIFGYYDYTTKYDIQYLHTPDMFLNEIYYILDNDINTSWGYNSLNNNGYITIKFRKLKKIKNIQIINKAYDAEEFYFPNINIYSSDDSHNWKLCNYKLTENNEIRDYSFNPVCEGKYINLEYANENAGYWIISEIEIIE